DDVVAKVGTSREQCTPASAHRLRARCPAACVVADGAMTVHRLPAELASTPGKVEILVEREEAFVEILSVPVRDRFERRSSLTRGSPAHAKNLIVPVELSRVRFAVAPVDGLAVGAEHLARRIDRLLIESQQLPGG